MVCSGEGLRYGAAVDKLGLFDAVLTRNQVRGGGWRVAWLHVERSCCRFVL